MPYMPTNFQPKNCAITTEVTSGSTNEDLLFYCTIDKYDKILNASIRLYDYTDGLEFGRVWFDQYLSKQKQVVIKNDDIKNISLTNYDSILPLDGSIDNVLCFDLNNCGFTFPKQCYYTIRIVTDKKDRWISDGYVTKKYSDTNKNYIGIDPNPEINADDQEIYINGNAYSYSMINNYYSLSGLTTTINGTTITIDKNAPDPGNTDDLIIEIDGIGYNVTAVNGTTITVSSSVPNNNLKKAYDMYRKVLTINKTDTNNKTIESGIPYSIKSANITSYDNYFTTIDTPSITFDTIENNTLASSVLNMTATYDGIVDYSYWNLYEDNQLLYTTEKRYNSNLSFYYDMLKNNHSYMLQLNIHDKNNYYLNNSINFEVSFTAQASKPKLVYDLDNHSVNIDISGSNSMEGQPSKGTYYTFTNDNILINNYDGTISWTDLKNRNGENLISFKNSQLLIGFKYFPYYHYKDTKLLKFGNNSIKITPEQIQINDATAQNLYKTDSGNIFGAKSNKDKNTYYEFDETNNTDNSLVAPKDDTMNDPYIVWNQIEVDNICYLILNFDSDGNVDKYNLYSLDCDSLIVTPTSAIEINTESPLSIILTSEKYYSVIAQATTLIDFTKSYSYNDIDTIIKNLNFSNNQTLNFLTNLKNKSLSAGTAVIEPGAVLQYNNLIRIDQDTNEVMHISSSADIITNIIDYSILPGHRYKYDLSNIYKNANNILMGKQQQSSDIIEIPTQWSQVTIFGTNSSNVQNIYTIDENQIWNFVLDIQSSQIAINTNKTSYTTNNKVPKFNETNVNYISGSISAKLGSIIDDCVYINDDIIHKLKFIEFANNHTIKFLKLRDGMLLPVNITLKNQSTNYSLVDSPCDISFDWTQIGPINERSLIKEVNKYA